MWLFFGLLLKSAAVRCLCAEASLRSHGPATAQKWIELDRVIRRALHTEPLRGELSTDVGTCT